MRNWLLAGASRGLGLAFFKVLRDLHPDDSGVIVSRKPPQDWAHETSLLPNSPWSWEKMDFSMPQAGKDLSELLQAKKITHAIYFAGGGPFKEFHLSTWEAHQWALNVTLLTPMRWIYEISKLGHQHSQVFQCLVVIGSQIAESKPDPKAVSYSVAKHGLAGLIKGIKAENSFPFQIHLWSPGYLQTDLLPPSKWESLKAKPVDIEARDLIHYLDKNT